MVVVREGPPMVILGNKTLEVLYHLRHSCFDTTNQHSDDSEEIDELLNNVIDEAITNGIPEEMIPRLEKMIKHSYYHLWRVNLRPEDIASVPPLQVQHITKPTRRESTSTT